MQRTVELIGPDETLSLGALLEALHRKGNRVPVHVAVYITHELARGLHHIHQTEMRAHGAVRAESVLLLRSGRVRLIDRRGSMVPGDRSADVTDVGRLAWEMLVGWPLDDGDGVRPRPAPLPPSLLRTGLPGAVDDLVLRALDLDPRRYPSAGALASDCTRFLATRPDPRRGLRLLLEQLFGEAVVRPPEDAAPTRLTAVPWRDSETTAAPPPVTREPARRPRGRWWRPWMTRMAIRVAETTIASLLALLALRALESPPPAPAPGNVHPATVIVPMPRP